jgi:hypothetical protein
MRDVKILMIFLGVLLISCGSTTRTISESTSEEAANNLELLNDMTKEGFLSGTIIYSEKEGDCAYVIDVDNEGHSYMLDPINLDKSFMKDGQQVWFKFTGLRMMNRCTKANPVNIIEMKNKES